jgi:hypothetical protein
LQQVVAWRAEWADDCRARFGDLIRIARAETEESGFAGRVGQVFGESIPSRSRVGPVIGDKGDDYAYSVFFEDTDEQVWFAPHLVEFVAFSSAAQMTGSPLNRILESRERLPFALPDPDGELKRSLALHRDDPK